MATRKLNELPNGIVKSATPVASGEVIDINMGGIAGGNAGTPVDPTDIVNKSYSDTKISGAGTVVDGNLAIWDGTSGTALKDDPEITASEVVTSAATLAQDDVLIGSDNSRNVESTSVLQVNTATSLLTVNNDITITGRINSPATKQGVLSNLEEIFSYNPSTTSTIYTQYIGTWSASRALLEVYINDSGTAETGSSSKFEISRSLNEAPIVHIGKQGNKNSNYQFWYRAIDNSQYELFFTTDSTENATVLYVANVLQQGEFVTDTISQSNDTDIFACTQNIETEENAIFRLYNGFQRIPTIVDVGDFTGTTYNLPSNVYYVAIKGYPTDGEIILPSISDDNANGTTIIIKDISGMVSQDNPLKITGDFVNGADAYYFVSDYSSIEITADSIDTDKWMIVNEYPETPSPQDGTYQIRSIYDMFRFFPTGTNTFNLGNVTLQPHAKIDMSGFTMRLFGKLFIMKTPAGGFISTNSTDELFLLDNPGSHLIAGETFLEAEEVDPNTGVLAVMNHPTARIDFQQSCVVGAKGGIINLTDWAALGFNNAFPDKLRVSNSSIPTGLGQINLSGLGFTPDNGTSTFTVDSGGLVKELTATNVDSFGLDSGTGGAGTGRFIEVIGNGSFGRLFLNNVTCGSLSADPISGVTAADDTSIWRDVVINNVLTDSNTNASCGFDIGAPGSTILIADPAGTFATISDLQTQITWTLDANSEKYTLLNAATGRIRYDGLGEIANIRLDIVADSEGATHATTFAVFKNDVLIANTAKTITTVNVQNNLITYNIQEPLVTGDELEAKFAVSVSGTGEKFQAARVTSQ